MITTMAVARIWTRLMRVNANGVPSRKIGGKKSRIEGGWNPLSSDSAALAIRIAA